MKLVYIVIFLDLILKTYQDCSYNFQIKDKTCYFITEITSTYALSYADIMVNMNLKNYSKSFDQVICLVLNHNYQIKFAWNYNQVWNVLGGTNDDNLRVTTYPISNVINLNERFIIDQNQNNFTITANHSLHKLAINNNILVQNEAVNISYKIFHFYPVNNFCLNCKTDYGLMDGKCYYMINSKTSFAIGYPPRASKINFSETIYSDDQIVCIKADKDFYYKINFKRDASFYLSIVNNVIIAQSGTSLDDTLFFFIRRNINLYSIYNYTQKRPIGLTNGIPSTVIENFNDLEQNWYFLSAD